MKNQKGALDITMVALVFVFTAASLTFLTVSQAANEENNKGPENKPTKVKVVSDTTLPKDQLSTTFGEAVNNRGEKYWLTASDAPIKGGEGDIKFSWKSRNEHPAYAFNGFEAGDYEHCFQIITDKPALLVVEAWVATENKGGGGEIARNEAYSSDSFEDEFCVTDTIVEANGHPDDKDWFYYHTLKILNDAELKIAQSSITKVN